MSKERPILFSGPMVRAIIEGRKTQTRRLCKPANKESLSFVVGDAEGTWGDEEGDVNFRCPYGREGDRLWVRETWAGPLAGLDAWENVNDLSEIETPEFCEYAADGGPTPEYLNADEEPVCRWTPSIHMPRWASRLTLEITGVRVERLQDISKKDALAEGVNVHPDHHGKPNSSIYSPEQAYRDLWDRINGPGSWDANPWVWVIDFKRLERSK